LPKDWISSVTVEEWNSILENSQSFGSAKTLGANDRVCFYVMGTSSFKGIATRTPDSLLTFEKVGDLNFFGIADSLEFVRDKENPTKYLKNFKGFANIGRPIPPGDMEMVRSSMSMQELPQARVEETASELTPEEATPGTSYETMFNLENSLRAFIVKELSSVSKNWIKERVPDPEMVKRWKDRMGEDSARPGSPKRNANLIEYSDFYDLATLILNRGNWNQCFKKFFGNAKVIEVKMYELVPIRNGIGHTRQLSEEDETRLKLYSDDVLRMINS
jgi:hypothetical protein